MREPSQASMNSRPHRVLILYSALPDEGSEPGVGWGFLRAYAVHSRLNNERLVVFIRAQHKGRCQQRLKEEGLGEDVELVGVEQGKGFSAINSLGGGRLGYLRWRRHATRAIAAATRANLPLSVHQATWATALLPHCCPQALRERFIWGPIASPRLNGGIFGHIGGQIVRTMVKRNLRQVASVVALNDYSFLLFEKIAKPEQHVFLEPHIFAEKRHTERDVRPHMVACVGRLIKRKRVDLVLEALAHDSLSGYQLNVIGDGPLRGRLELLSRRLGIQDRVFFRGAVDRLTARTLIAEAGVLVHPSSREGAGFVVGEAAAAGTSVVAFNDTGAATVVRLSKGLGILVERDRNEVQRLAEAIRRATLAPRPRPSNRWRAARFKTLLPEWWLTVESE